MSIYKQSMLYALGVGLFAIALSPPLEAQDRDQIRSLASTISNEAQKTWYAMQDPLYIGSLDKMPNTLQLNDALYNFINMAMQFEQESQEQPPQTATLRSMARQLIREASIIKGLMFKADTPDSALWEWGKVDDAVETLKNMY